jgi:MFS family permease
VLAIALSAAVGGFVGAIVNGAAGGSWRAGLVAAFIGMALVGGLAAVIARRVIVRRRPPLFGNGEVVLWVRARSPVAEEKAQAILLQQAAQAVRVHEIDLDKRFRDVPLSSLAKELVR